MPAYAAVPHAMTVMRRMPRSSSSPNDASSGMTTWPSTMRPSRVLATASGCSETSLRMNDDHPPFSAAEASQSTSNGSTSTGSPCEVGDGDRVGGDLDDLVLADRDGALRELDEGRDIGAEEVLAVAEPDDERRVAAGADDDAGLVAVHGEQGERAVEARHRVAERLAQVAGRPVLPAEQHGGDLGVGLGLEREALGEQLVLQLGEVLDDAVVDERESTLVAEVRVRVAVGGAAVRRPPGVADAGAAVVQRVRLELVGEHLQLAGALRGLDGAVVVDDGHPRRVVATVFEAAQAAHEHVEAVALSDISDDSTHSGQL